MKRKLINYFCASFWALCGVFPLTIWAALPAPGGIDTNLGLWLKADTGVFTDTGCLAGAAVGNSIQCWADQSGSGNDFTGVTSPVLTDPNATDINFLSVLDFDGTDVLSNVGSLFGAASDATIFAVGFTGGGATSTVFGAGAGGDNVRAGISAADGVELFSGVNVGNNGSFVGDTISANQPHLFGWDWQYNTNGSASLDGNRSLSGTAHIGGTINGTPSYIGGDAAADFFTGSLAEVVVYSGDQTASRSRIESYLGMKYGLTLTSEVSATYIDTLPRVGGTGLLGGTASAQSFTATSDATLIEFDTRISRASGAPDPITVNAYYCNGDVGDTACVATPDQTMSFMAAGNSLATKTVTFPVPINVTAGQQFTIAFHSVDNYALQLSYVLGSGTNYTGGQVYRNGVADPTQDMEIEIRALVAGPSNYVNSAGTDIWAVADNTGYGNDIFALGQDNDSSLNTTQSKSANSDDIVTMSNPTSLDNLDFLFLSNNNGAVARSTSEIPAGTTDRITREWKVDHTNDVGNVDIAFDVTGLGLDATVAQAFSLLIDDDDDFSADLVGQVTASSFASNVVTFTGVTLADAQFVTVASLDNIIAGTVYTDEGVTNIGAGKTVRLLIDGVDSGLTDDTDASGGYAITGAPVVGLTGGEVLTVYLDDETENGVSVTVGSGPVLNGFDVYQNYLIARHDNAGFLDNTHLATGDNADPGTSSDDISSIYAHDGSNNLTTTSGVELFVPASNNFRPGANLDLAGTLDVDGSLDLETNNLNITGDLDVALSMSADPGSTITMDGTTAQNYDQSVATTSADVVIANTSADVTMINSPMRVRGLTINDGATLYANGNDVSLTGAFANGNTVGNITATFRLQGGELLTLTADTDSGTVEYVGNGIGSADNLAMGGLTSFYELVVNDTSATNADTFSLQGALTVSRNLTVSDGTLNFNANNADLNGDLTIAAAGVLDMTNSSAVTLMGNFTNNNPLGVAATNSTFTFDPSVDHTITGVTNFYNFVASEASNDATDSTLTFVGAPTIGILTGGSLSLTGLDADDRLNLVGGATINVVDGSGAVTGSFLDITSNTLQDNGATMNPEFSPANSIDNGGNAGWFDTTPPTDPAAAPDLQAASDTGSSNTDNITNDNTPTLDVVCTEIGEIINVYSDSPAANTLVGTHTCVAVATESVTLSTLADGTHNLHYNGSDAAGNTSANSPALTLTIDTSVPSAPTITTPTNGAPVAGFAEPGSSVTITTTSGATCTVNPVPAGGAYSCSLVPAPVNGEDVNVVVTDTAGNVSPTTTVVGGIDTAAPTDSDGDGNPDTDEDAGFNGGDGDGDGIADSLQANVSGAFNAVTGAYTTLRTAGACTFISQNAFVAESTLPVQDGSASYPVGLVDFQVVCPNAGDSSTVTLHYAQQYDTNGWVYKKFDSLGNQYATLSSGITFNDVVLASGPQAGNTVTNVSFTVTDGDPNTDEDGVADGVINDPSGPAIPVTSTSNSGGGSAVKHYPHLICNGGARQCVEQYPVATVGALTDYNDYLVCVSAGQNPYDCSKSWLLKNDFNICTQEQCGSLDTEGRLVSELPREDELAAEAAALKAAEAEREAAVKSCATVAYKRYPERRGSGVPEGLFADTLQTHVWYSHLVDLAEQDVVSGDDDTGYARLDDEISRAEVVKIMTIAREDTLTRGDCVSATTFPDVQRSDWHHDFVQNMEQQDLVHGYEDGLYRPGQTIVKAELYKIAALSFGYTTAEIAKSEWLERGDLAPWYGPYADVLEAKISLPKALALAPMEKPMSRGEVFMLLSLMLEEQDGR